MIENKHVTIAHTGETIPKTINLGIQNENVDAYIYFYFADKNLKDHKKYLLATNGEYSEVFPILDDRLKVSTALTSIAGKWTLQVAFCENEVNALTTNDVLNERHISLSNEFLGFVIASKYPVSNASKPMDANLLIWYEEVNNNMESLTNSVEEVKGGFDGLKNQVVKDWNENDETSGAYIQNRPMYKTVESVLYEETSGSAFSRNGDFLCYTVHFEGFEFAQGTKCRFVVDDTYVFEGFYNDSHIEYSCGDSVGRIYGNTLEMPYYIYEESGTDKGHNFKVEVLVKNIVIEDSYVPILQSDYSVEDKNDSRYIANKVIKEGYAYEVLMKNATFEYESAFGYRTHGVINGYHLLTPTVVESQAEYEKVFVILLNNGVQTYEILGWHRGQFLRYDDEAAGLEDFSIYEQNFGLPCEVEIPTYIYEERTQDVKVTILLKQQEGKVLIKEDGMPLTNPLVLDSTIDYTLLPFKGDEALQTIIDGRQILVKVPNADGSNFTTNFMPVFQYQLPNHENSYLYLLYLKDGLATNLTNALGALMQGGAPNFDAVYGSIKLALSKSYTECPLK